MGIKFKFSETDIKNLYLIEPNPFIDHRGMFARVFCKDEFKEIDHSKEIVNIKIKQVATTVPPSWKNSANPFLLFFL